MTARWVAAAIRIWKRASARSRRAESVRAPVEESPTAIPVAGVPTASLDRESLAIVAGGLAHDLNNLLTGVLGHADLASALFPPHSIGRLHMAKIAESARRAAELSGRLLASAGLGKLLDARIDINRLIERAVAELPTESPAPRGVAFDFDPALPDVMGDENQLAQAFRNLALNAVEARRTADDTLTIRTRSQSREPGASGGEVRIEFADTGAGIEPELFERVFEPFFSTKAFGRGLGLPAVRGIAALHGGSASVMSEAGRGTTVTIVLPAATAVETIPEPETQPVTPTSGKLRRSVLIIDDDESVRMLLGQMLQRSGWEALSADGGRKGIQAFAGNVERIAFVILDSMMPEMDGLAVRASLRSIRPHLPILFCTGYSSESLDADWLSGPTGLLLKPFSLRDLDAAIADLLRKATPAAVG